MQACGTCDDIDEYAQRLVDYVTDEERDSKFKDCEQAATEVEGAVDDTLVVYNVDINYDVGGQQSCTILSKSAAGKVYNGMAVIIMVAMWSMLMMMNQ